LNHEIHDELDEMRDKYKKAFEEFWFYPTFHSHYQVRHGSEIL